MSSWTFEDLETFDQRICGIAKENNLDWFPIVYETCDYYEMIGNMSYHGMPSHYAHWSFGKTFERTHQMYNLGAEGLPYELIINSNPSIAYLMLENPLYLQVLIMAHCVGHSDFFKNNKEFVDTHPEWIVSKFRNARKRIQAYIEDPSIGIVKVEQVLDAAHAIQFQINRHGQKYFSASEQKIEAIENWKLTKKYDPKCLPPDLDKVPLKPEYDLLAFILEHCRFLESWEADILEIVREEAKYFIPQIKTKIMNEGWASFWHYRICHELELDSAMHIPFIKSHNQVIRPHTGAVNPYHVGFTMFKDIEERLGLEECFIAREICNDESFIRTYLTRELCEKLGLFKFVDKEEFYLITEVSDEDGWKNIRSGLIKQSGMNNIPIIYVEEIEQDDTLILHHEHDGRDIETSYAKKVVGHIETLWKKSIKLITTIEDEPFEI